MKMMPDGRYELKSFAIDTERTNVTAYAVFKATHTGEGGPPPTGKSTQSATFTTCISTGRRSPDMTKIWISGWSLKELGWA